MPDCWSNSKDEIICTDENVFPPDNEGNFNWTACEQHNATIAKCPKSKPVMAAIAGKLIFFFYCFKISYR